MMKHAMMRGREWGWKLEHAGMEMTFSNRKGKCILTKEMNMLDNQTPAWWWDCSMHTHRHTRTHIQ